MLLISLLLISTVIICLITESFALSDAQRQQLSEECLADNWIRVPRNRYTPNPDYRYDNLYVNVVSNTYHPDMSHDQRAEKVMMDNCKKLCIDRIDDCEGIDIINHGMESTDLMVSWMKTKLYRYSCFVHTNYGNLHGNRLEKSNSIQLLNRHNFHMVDLGRLGGTPARTVTQAHIPACYHYCEDLGSCVGVVWEEQGKKCHVYTTMTSLMANGRTGSQIYRYKKLGCEHVDTTLLSTDELSARRYAHGGR